MANSKPTIYEFCLKMRVISDSEVNARKELRKQLGIGDHIPDEFIEKLLV